MPYPVVQHSMASPSTVAHVMYQKFVNALPLYRQEKEWESIGVKLSRSTMANWIMVASENWLFSGSPKGAKASATVYSIIETAKANGLEPYDYLQFLFKQLPGFQFEALRNF